MINTLNDLRKVLAKEKPFYFCAYTTRSQKRYCRFSHQHQYELWRYVRLLRTTEYLLNSHGCRFLKMICFYLLERRRNNLGNKLGICLNQNVVEEGFMIDHIGTITINPQARIGKNFHIHGNVCVGRGHGKVCPIIGDNVDVGWGAIICGDIRIADGVIVGANSVVNKSIDVPNSVWAGVPAHRIR